MKMPSTLIALAIAIAALPLLASNLSAESARIEVILVAASNKGGEIDPALRGYASTLERLFRFDGYRQVQRKTIQVDVPGEAESGLAAGQSITLATAAIAAKNLPVDIEWRDGAKRLLHTRLNLRPDAPAVLGGPRMDDGNGSWLLIVQWRR